MPGYSEGCSALLGLSYSGGDFSSTSYSGGIVRFPIAESLNLGLRQNRELSGIWKINQGDEGKIRDFYVAKFAKLNNSTIFR